MIDKRDSHERCCTSRERGKQRSRQVRFSGTQWYCGEGEEGRRDPRKVKLEKFEKNTSPELDKWLQISKEKCYWL